MDDLNQSLGVLSAMITPAVLIAACGTLILTTSQRVAWITDRTRKVSDQFEQLMQIQTDGTSLAEERAILLNQIGLASKRSRLLQRALFSLYLALSSFIASSVAIGVVAILGLSYTWIPIALGLLGAALLFYTSLVLIFESRIAVVSVNQEMKFLYRLGQQQASHELLQGQPVKYRLSRRLHLKRGQR
jgi:hypothetical protein